MAPPPKSFQETIRELWTLLTTYARQETVGPLKNLGRRVGFGIGGSVLFALGWFLITLGVARLLETHEPPGIGTFLMRHNWLIYVIWVALLGIGMYLGGYRKIRNPDADLTISPTIDLDRDPAATTRKSA